MGFPFADDAMLFWDEENKKVKDLFVQQGAGLDVHIDRNEPTLLLMSQFVGRLLEE